MAETPDVRAAKQTLRTAMRRHMTTRRDVEARSDRIFAQLTNLSEWIAARSILWYVDLPGEVRTQPFLARELILGQRRCAVTWCEPKELKLAWIESLDDLTVRTLGILEPKEAIRSNPHRWLDVNDVDVVLVPGMAFSPRGQRLGHGKGYYDHLLSRARPEVTLIGLAFEEQVHDEIPCESHDIVLDYVVTPDEVYRSA